MEGYKKPTITNGALEEARKKAISDMKEEGINPSNFKGNIMNENFDAFAVVNELNTENKPEESSTE